MHEKFVIGRNRFCPFMRHQVGIADRFGHRFAPRSPGEKREVASGLGDRPVVLAGGKKVGVELPYLLFPEIVVPRGKIFGAQPSRQQENGDHGGDQCFFHVGFDSKNFMSRRITRRRKKNQYPLRDCLNLAWRFHCFWYIQTHYFVSRSFIERKRAG